MTRPTIITEETIENRVMHPGYNESGGVQRDDIALLKLSRSISWSREYRLPIITERLVTTILIDISGSIALQYQASKKKPG